MSEKRTVGRVHENGKVHFQVWIDPELGSVIREIARRERRTLSAQVEILIEHGLRASQASA